MIVIVQRSHLLVRLSPYVLPSSQPWMSSGESNRPTPKPGQERIAVGRPQDNCRHRLLHPADVADDLQPQVTLGAAADGDNLGRRGVDAAHHIQVVAYTMADPLQRSAEKMGATVGQAYRPK